MDELTFNKEYHIAYLLGTPDFEKRLFDAYMGLGTFKRPPYIEDLLVDTTQTQALILLESIKNEPYRVGMTNEEWEYVHEAVWQNDNIAAAKVLFESNEDEIHNVIDDILRFIDKYRMCTLSRKNGAQDHFQAQVMYPPISQVW